jgi:hypothetical protein
MPVYLKELSEFRELEKFKSVLLVPCRFCPAASLAVRQNKPYFEFFRKFLKTAIYEDHIERIKDELKKKGVKAEVFRSRWLHQFVVCMWTSKRRQQLAKRAGEYDALVVLGCEAAVQTVYDAVKSTSSRVFQGMRSEGIMTVKPSFHLPGNISLELNDIIPLVHQNKESVPWVSL